MANIMDILQEILASNDTEEANTTYANKFSKYEVLIDFDGDVETKDCEGKPYKLQQRPACEYSIDGKRITVYNRNILEKISKFHTHITKLKVITNLKVICNFGSSIYSWQNLMEFVSSKFDNLEILAVSNVNDGAEITSFAETEQTQDNKFPLVNSFPKLHTFEAAGIYFQCDRRINECFPNLQTLELVYILATEPTMFEVNLPKLKKLKISLSDDDISEPNNRTINIDPLLNLNTALEIVQFDVDFLSSTFVHKPHNLKELKVEVHESEWTDEELINLLKICEKIEKCYIKVQINVEKNVFWKDEVKNIWKIFRNKSFEEISKV